MTILTVHSCRGNTFPISPETSPLEIVERKFRGHPDSLADMVAQRFSQLYISTAWQRFPELGGKHFPNFSADKVTLSGASTKLRKSSYEVLKPIDCLLIGKITNRIGGTLLDLDGHFRAAIDDILHRSLRTTEFRQHIKTSIYSVDLAGVDHGSSFYSPHSVDDLLRTLSAESHANDTVYVVAYAPLTATEKLSIALDTYTASSEFYQAFPQIGSDIKALLRRRAGSLDINICLPVCPERVRSNHEYTRLIREAADSVRDYIRERSDVGDVQLSVNTKDTPERKYYAVWGTSLSKGDIGAVGRGNRQQGFISSVRPSTNEAFSGKNPSHFAGLIYQLVAEEISHSIYNMLREPNVVYVTANNGDKLYNPTSIDILAATRSHRKKAVMREVAEYGLNSIDTLRETHIRRDVYDRFMSPRGCD